MTLNEQILSIIQNSQSSDYDQRSALGMARTWVDGREPEFGVGEAYKGRDGLARDLIAALEAAGPEYDEIDLVRALTEARAVVNKPFRVETFVGTAKAKLKEVKRGDQQ